jgi:hypothetical protein
MSMTTAEAPARTGIARLRLPDVRLAKNGKGCHSIFNTQNNQLRGRRVQEAPLEGAFKDEEVYFPGGAGFFASD